jgi:tRNA modification GTPase
MSIEQMGVARSRQALVSSSIALFVIDRSRPAGPDDIQVATLLAERLGDGGVIIARNKSDLPDAGGHDPVLSLLPGVPVVDISTRNGDGIVALEAALHDLALSGTGSASEPALVTIRQHDALRRALAAVDAAQEGHALGLPLDLLAVDVRAALHAVGEVTGEHVDAAVLDEIFSRFCIGK